MSENQGLDSETEDGLSRPNRWLGRILSTPAAPVDRLPWLPNGMGGSAAHADNVTPTPSEAATEPSNDLIVQLDVSVGIDDIEVLRTISLRFDGLPPGVRLTHGLEDAPGSWTVNAADLSNLCVLMPASTPDFDLDIGMDTEDGPQRAQIRVSAQAVSPDAELQFVELSFGAPADISDVRIKVYADGLPVFDRVVTWTPGGPAAADVRTLTIPVNWANAAPYELLVRYEGDDGLGAGPVLKHIDTPNGAVALTGRSVSGRYTQDGDGITWKGDLTVGLRYAGEAEGATEPDAPMPTEPPQGARTDDDEPKPEPTQELEPAPEPETAQPLAATPLETDPQPEAEASKTPAPSTLTLYVDSDDLGQPAFFNELRNLRDFIQSHGEGAHESVYDRLHVDVSQWRDMRAIGPSGAAIDLDSLLPSLAPLGGLDGGRPMFRLLGADAALSAELVRVSGLPPGAILSHGKNLGEGTWELTNEEATAVHVLPPPAHPRTLCLQIRGADLQTPESDPRSIVLGGALARLASRDGTWCFVDIPVDSATAEFDDIGDEISVTVGDVPAGVLIAAGTNHGDGIWTLTCEPGDGIELAIPPNRDRFAVSLTCVSGGVGAVDGAVTTRRVRIDADAALADVQETHRA